MKSWGDFSVSTCRNSEKRTIEVEQKAGKKWRQADRRVKKGVLGKGIVEEERRSSQEAARPQRERNKKRGLEEGRKGRNG